jgi:SnoaL-like domain
VFRFKDGQVTSWEVWFSAPTLEMISFGCFAPGKGGSEQLQTIADKYLAAWASGDKARIAALYHPDALFSDTALGLQAQGAAAISELGEERFGAGSPVTFKIIDLYAQTKGPDPPTEQQPEQGAIIGVGIHYRCSLVVNGKPASVEGLTTFELGTRQGKIVRPRSERSDHPGGSVLRHRQPPGLRARALSRGPDHP